MTLAAAPRTAPAGALRATIAEDPVALAADLAAWDELTDAASQPFCAPAWLLGWWEHVRPRRSRLAVVLVHDDDGTLVGVGPGFLERARGGAWRWRPLGARTCQRVEPLARPGREADVAAAITGALAAHHPRPDVLTFEGVASTSPWPALLAAAWPGRVAVRTTGAATALTLGLGAGGFDDWFMGKSSHFRQRLRKQHKVVAKAGGAFRLADAASAPADIEAFLRVHAGRWAERGGTSAVPPPVAALLRATGPALVASGRLRIWSLDVAGETVASSLVFRAGAEVGYWLNGFDGAHARLEPSKLSILHVVEDAFALGATRLDLGEGVYEYKRRFADAEEQLVHLALVPAAATRRPRVEAALAPARIRREASRRLPPATRERLRGRLAALSAWRAAGGAGAAAVAVAVPGATTAAAPVARIVEDPAALAPCTEAWAALAIATGHPFCTPGWLLAWWRHAAPAGARLAVGVVEDPRDGALLGVAPFFLERGRGGAVRWRPLGAGACQRVEPIATPGREEEVAAALGAALRALPTPPDVLSFEGVDGASAWPARLAAAVAPAPGLRAPTLTVATAVAPAVRLDAPGLDAWLEGKGSHFRQRLRRDRRQAERAGATFRRSDAASAAADLDRFLAMHLARWAPEGGSGAVTPGVAAALREAGPGLVAGGHVQCWNLDIDGATVASRVLFIAGREAGAWLSAFDPAHARLRPSMVTLLLTLGELLEQKGPARLDLGEGAFDYKQRFADHEDTLVDVLVPCAAPHRLPRALVAAGPPVVRAAVVRHLTAEQKARLRKLVGTRA